MLRHGLFAGIAIAFGFCAAAGAADYDLTLYREGETYIKPTISMEGAVFSESKAWLGESREVIGDHVGRWTEYAITPGVEGALALGGAGLLYGRGSAIGAGSQGLDAAGSDFDNRHPERLEVEDLYFGWRSGTLFPSLGENAIDVSYGKQKYQIGNGYFMWDGASDGGDRGAYWLGPRKAFYTTGIVRLNTGPYKVEGFYLKPNDNPYTSTDVVGGNFEYKTTENGMLGVTYLKIIDSAKQTRDGMDFFDFRADLTPLPFDRSFSLSGEWAQEVNGHSINSSAWYGEAGYTFADTDWKPHVSYRYAWFGGDDPDSADLEVWDPLFYGFSDWSTWYEGEIIGEFVAINRDLAIQTVRLRVQPSDALTLQLIYNYYSLVDNVSELVARDLNPRAANIHSKYAGQGLDLVADWFANDHLEFMGVVATFRPGAAMQQYVAADTSSWWTHFMFYTKVSF